MLFRSNDTATTEIYTLSLHDALPILMVHSLLITRGSRGATLFQQTNKKIERYEIAGVSAGEIADPTGCGDVFGAAFLYHMLKTNNAPQSAGFANATAAFNATVQGAEALDALKEQSKAELPS